VICSRQQRGGALRAGAHRAGASPEQGLTGQGLTGQGLTGQGQAQPVHFNAAVRGNVRAGLAPALRGKLMFAPMGQPFG
jgi:hypothetical protein